MGGRDFGNLYIAETVPFFGRKSTLERAAEAVTAMTIFHLIVTGWLIMAAMQLLLYFVQRTRRDAGIVDAGWAFGVGLLAILFAVNGDGYGPRRLLMAILAGGWSLRLAIYLLRDRVFGSEEDGRYQMLREKWGDRAQLYFFLFFQIQAVWSVLFSIPLLIVARNNVPSITLWDWGGILIWIIAVAGESAADSQLARFRRDPENKGLTCRVGLWRYSRHPNYFFEWIHWWTYVFLAVGAPHFWVAFIGPVVMIVFLYKITGIPYTEKRAVASRGDDYRDYQRTTSAFVPWFPRKRHS